jgi:hypothetical protein
MTLPATAVLQSRRMRMLGSFLFTPPQQTQPLTFTALLFLSKPGSRNYSTKSARRSVSVITACAQKTPMFTGSNASFSFTGNDTLSKWASTKSRNSYRLSQWTDR